MSLSNGAATEADATNATAQQQEEERQQMHQVKMQAQYPTNQGLLDPLNPVKFQDQGPTPMAPVKLQEQQQEVHPQPVPVARPFAAATVVNNVDEKAGIPPNQGQQQQQQQQIPTVVSTAQLSGGGGGGGHEIPVALEIRHPALTGFSPLSILDAYALHLVLGLLGAHHFRMGRWTMGCIYLCTLAGFGFGWVVDLFRMYELVQEYNRKEGRLEGNESKSILIGDGYALWVLDFFGVVHAYYHRPGWAVFYLLTIGGFGLGAILDLFRMPDLAEGLVARRNGDLVKSNKYVLSDVYVTWFPPSGLLGGHHFYLGNIGKGILYFFTIGLFGVGWIVDGFQIPAMTKRVNERMNIQADIRQGVPEARIV